MTGRRQTSGALRRWASATGSAARTGSPLPHDERDDGEQPPRRERPAPADDVRERRGQGGGQDAAAVERGGVQAGHARDVPGKSPPITTGTATLPAVMATPIRTVPTSAVPNPSADTQQRAGQHGHQRRRDHPPGAQRARAARP